MLTRSYRRRRYRTIQQLAETVPFRLFYCHSPTMEEKKDASTDISVPAASWKHLKRGFREFEIPALETSAQQNEFDAEVQQAEDEGLSVEYVTRGDKMVVIMECMGYNMGKAFAKKAMDRALDGGNILTLTNTTLCAQGAAIQLGQLIPDVLCYPDKFKYDFRGSTPPHPPLVVEIDQIEDCSHALNKVNYYFAPTFAAPDGSMMKEVWVFLLARAAPTVPVLTLPVHTSPQPFAGIAPILNTATAEGDEEPTIIVFFHRNGAYAPSYGLLNWNTSLAAPAGSFFTGRLDSNKILRQAYQG